MMTFVPPAVGPLFGSMPVTLGIGMTGVGDGRAIGVGVDDPGIGDG